MAEENVVESEAETDRGSVQESDSGATSGERQLTKAEQKRKEVFLQTCDRFESEGYHVRNVTITVAEANGQAILWTVPPVIALMVVFFLLHPVNGDQLLLELSFGQMAAIFVTLFVLIFAHEGIHGLVWGIFAPDHFKTISFGVIWKMVTPYCTCSQPLSRGAYFTGALAPTVVLGIIPCIIALVTGSFFLMAVGCLMIIGGGGDIAIVAKLIRAHITDPSALYLDHPYECGSVVFEK